MANAVFTMKLEEDLRRDFIAEVKAAHQPASQVVRELMRGYIRQRRQERDYDEFLHQKVTLAREQIAMGLYRSNEEVAAAFAARRAGAQQKAKKPKT